MAKKQTRRSISVRGSTYEQLRAWCDAHHVAMSEFIETRIAEYLHRKEDNGRTASRVPATSHMVARSSRPALRLSEPERHQAPPARSACPAPSPEVPRPVRAAPPPSPTLPSAGRPAPTPAEKIARVYHSCDAVDASDYRAIQF